MTKILSIAGMMCPHCVMHVKKALEGLDGVISAEVDLSKNNATVTMNKEISDEIFSRAIEEAGYTVTEIK